MIEDILTKLKTKSGKLTIEESFELSSVCAKYLNDKNELKNDEARRIIIHVLDGWGCLPCETVQIWTDLVESVGFYPYIHRHDNDMKLISLSDQARANFHLSSYLPVALHSEQKKVSEWLLAGKNMVVSAPTSFGKSLLIEELVASRKYKNIIIIQPTLALLDETRLKLKKYSDFYKIIVRTSQETSKDKGNLFLLTAERVMEYSPLPKIDLLIVDEFYKMSLRRIDERATTLNNAFLKIVSSSNTQFYLLGPNIDDITPEFKEKYSALFYRTTFSLVDCNVIDVSSQFNHSLSDRKQEEEKLPVLFKLLDSLRDSQTLIYCSSPARARRFAKKYFEHLQEGNVSPDRMPPLVEWINKNISPSWSLSSELTYGIAFHDGSLQKHIANSVIRYFNAGQLRCVFCTSTIIEGVNTSAKNVVLFDGKKASSFIDYFDYSNIKGRSGRLMEHYVGNIYNFVTTPPQERIVIDIPFIEQDSAILTDEILINIPQENIKPQVSDRYNKLRNIPEDLMQIIKTNGVSVNGQMSIYYALQRDITVHQQLISWTQMPSWDALIYVLSLAENNLFNFQDRHGVLSVKQLVRYLNLYRKHKNIMAIVSDIYQSRLSKIKDQTSVRKRQCLDDAIETTFHIYRHWFQFNVPKALRVVDSLQRYVCEQNHMKAGSYSFYIQQLENDFVPERLSILLEYGIPSSTVIAIQSLIPQGINDDDLVEYIKSHKEELSRSLMQYEIERLEYSL